MKKALLLICLFVFFSVPAFAICDYLDFCPQDAYDLSSEKTQTISRRIGATFLAEKIAQEKIKKQLKQITKQKLDVSVKTYSFMDLIHGRFKSITISGKNLNINGVYLTSLELKTLCDFNYVKFDKNSVTFKENMILSFFTTISDEDLMKTMKSTGYLDKLNCVNVRGCGITFFQLSGADVNIKNNKLNFKVRVTSQLLLNEPLDMDMSTGLKAENGRLVLEKVDLGHLAKGVDLSKIANRMNKMNPLTFSLEVLENKNTKMCIKDVKIIENKVIVSGNIFIPKSGTLIE